MIEVKNVTVRYGKRTILEGVSFSVKKGEVFVILGGSGCGKSTLMNQMIGLQHPKSGEIWLDGVNIVKAEGKKKQKILGQIGVMFQSGALFGSMTLLENLLLPLEEWTHLPLEAQKVVALDKLKLVGLADFSNFLPAELSGGMQKRAAIARALALDPKIIFLDEPSAGLDPITSANIDALIKRLAKILGITFVVVTHELASIENIADHVIMLDKGVIIASGKVQDLKEHSDNAIVKNFFNRKAVE